MSRKENEAIPFSRPTVLGVERRYVQDAIAREELRGGGYYSGLCEAWFEREYGAAKAFLTTSCTQSLQAAALLCDIQPGDEVIMPAYTYVATANMFALLGKPGYEDEKEALEKRLK